MEAISGIAAVAQLVQLLGTTIHQVREAYSQVRDMDDLVRDFDSQLDATRMLLSILGDGISSGTLNTSMEGWWRQSELERLLRSCQQLFHRLHDVFIKIAHQRSTVKNLRAWIRLKGYDSDINHLRLSINTCTNALQLPVIIQNIHSSRQARPSPLENEIPDLLEELATRMANLESSIARTQDDLVSRALQKGQKSFPSSHRLSTIEEMVKELKTEVSTLAASQQSKTSTACPSETEAQLAQIQARLSHVQVGIKDEENGRPTLEPQEMKEKDDMENETRSMLELMNGLVGSVKGYASTIDSMSTSTRRMRRKPILRRRETVVSGLRAHSSQGLGFIPPQLSKDKRCGIADWVEDVDDEDNRRMRTAEDLMKTKNYIKVLPHLERLLSSKDGTADTREESRLCGFMAQALYGSTSKNELIAAYCQTFPAIKSKLDDLRLEYATKALDREDYTLVTDILEPYKASLPAVTNSASTDLGDNNTMQKIQLVFGQALLESASYKNKHEAMLILEALLGRSSLRLTDRGVVNDCLAKAFYLKGDYEKAKKHGILACQIKMDLIGRDDEATQRSIALIVNICLETQDSDEAIWRQMLPDTKTTDKLQAEIPRPFAISRYLPDPTAEWRMRRVHQSMGVNWYTRTAIKFLKDNYSLLNISSVFGYQDIMCLDCLTQYLDDSQAFALSWQQRCCLGHQFKLDDGQWTKGLSLMHYFAMTRPRGSGNSNNSPRPDCISELSILIDKAKTTIAHLPDQKHKEGQEAIATPSPSTYQLNHGFLLHELINTPRHYMPFGAPRDRHIDITPLWGAALSGNLTTVSFFLSLGETDVTLRARSVLLLKRPGQQTKSPIYLSEEARLRRRAEISQGQSNVFRAVSVAFNALPVRSAEYLVGRQMTRGKQDFHWCFSNTYLLEKVLRKCGEGSADLLVQDWHSDYPEVRQLSLLESFISSVCTQKGYGLNEATRKEFTAMLRLLLRHSKIDQKSASSVRRLTELINSIHGAVDSMVDPLSRSHFTPGLEQKVMGGVALIEVLMDGGYMIGIKDRLSLQACIDRLTICEETLLNLKEVEDGLSNNIKTLEQDIMGAQRQSLSNLVKEFRLVRRKDQKWRKIQEHDESRQALVAKLDTRDRLKKLCNDIDKLRRSR